MVGNYTTIHKDQLQGENTVWSCLMRLDHINAEEPVIVEGSPCAPHRKGICIALLAYVRQDDG